MKLLFATSLVECLLYALLVRPPLAGDTVSIPLVAKRSFIGQLSNESDISERVKAATKTRTL